MGCEVCKRKKINQFSTEEFDAAPINQNFTNFNKEKNNKTTTYDKDITMKSDEFDEVKAKELVKYLLSNDIKFYKNQLYDVINLNSDEFKKLFNGESDYIYNVKDQETFKKLAVKFENFSILLYEWYQNDKKYHDCLKQLWKNFINLNDIKDLDDNEMEKKLRDTDYKNWDNVIKEEFKIVIKGASDLSEKFKIFIKKRYKQLDDVIRALQKTKAVMEKEEKEEKSYNFCIKENLSMISDKLIENLFPIFFDDIIINNKDNKDDDNKDKKEDTKEDNTKVNKEDSEEVRKEYNEKANKKDNKNANKISEKAVKETDDKKVNEINDVLAKEKRLTKNKISQLIKKVAKMYIKGEIPEDFDINKSLEEIGNYAHQFESIKLLQPDMDQIRNVCNNKLFGYGILWISYLNLCYNIESTRSFIENSKTKIDELNTKLEEIKKDFNSHKKQVSLLPSDDIEEALKQIEEIGLLFEDDKRRIIKLINEIENEIKNQKKEKNRGFFKIFTNIGMLGLNITLAKNISKSKYGLSAIFNGISAATDTAAIIQIEKNLNKLNELLKSAKEEEKKIEKALDELKEKYIKYQNKESPKGFADND